MKYVVIRIPISEDPEPDTGIGVASFNDEDEVQFAVWSHIHDSVSNNAPLPITIEED